MCREGGKHWKANDRLSSKTHTMSNDHWGVNEGTIMKEWECAFDFFLCLYLFSLLCIDSTEWVIPRTNAEKEKCEFQIKLWNLVFVSYRIWLCWGSEDRGIVGPGKVALMMSRMSMIREGKERISRSGDSFLLAAEVGRTHEDALNPKSSDWGVILWPGKD